MLITGERFIVAYLRNNRQAFPPATAGSGTSSFRSAATAGDAVADWIVADPTLAEQLHVIRQTEAGGGTVAEPGTWSTASTPTSVVAGAEAVRLSSGAVLVAGDADAKALSLRQSAVFDLDAGTWSTAQLGTARQLHAVALLPSGKVLASMAPAPRPASRS